jgi:hypothetical protein
MAIAVYNSPPGGGPTSLPAKTDEKIVGIQLNTPGSNNVSPFWTVFGKVVVNNTTASPATVRAQLVVAPATVLDTSKATIPANGFVSISLEGVPETDAAMCVEIHCEASSSATAELARLIAISVDRATVVTC